jgi:hypothetical protein
MNVKGRKRRDAIMDAVNPPFLPNQYAAKTMGRR